MGIVGIAIAGIITNLTTFMILKVFKNTDKRLICTKVAFFNSSTIDNEGLKEYFYLAAPFFIINFLDFFMWELMTIAAGLLSVEDQAT